MKRVILNLGERSNGKEQKSQILKLKRVTTKPKACEPTKSRTGKMEEGMKKIKGNVVAFIYFQGASTGS